MKIMVLAGGFDQIALINGLKERGNEVVLADYFENPPAKKYADRHFQISTLDENAIMNLAKEEKVDLLTTACTDQALLTVARVSEQLNLPCYISAEAAMSVTNKAYMKQKFKECDIPTADFILLESEDEIAILENEIFRYPMIVKPCDCNSSKGVIKVTDYDELRKAVKNAFILSRSKKVVVESYLEGVEISIDVWKDKEGAKVLSVSGTSKIESNKDAFTIYQSKYPISMSTEIIEKIKSIADKICKEFVLENCPVLIQAMINGNDVNVIEFSARMGGGSKYKLIEYMSGIDIMNVYINRILGNTEQIITPIWSDKYIELNYVYANNGIFSKVVNFKELLDMGVIKEFFQYKPEGSIIEKRTTSSDRIAGFLLVENSSGDLNNRRKEVIDQVDVINTQGASMMYKECFI